MLGFLGKTGIAKRRILILEPRLDQAKAIAKFLAGDKVVLVGGNVGPYTIKSDKNYHDIINAGNYDIDPFDTIVPTGAESTEHLLQSRKGIKVGTITFPESNLRVFDKLWMHELAGKCSIPVPKTFLGKEAVRKFPVFYKSIREKSGGARGIVKSQADLDKLKQTDTLMFQEYIPGRSTFGVGFLARQGRIITDFIHEESLSWPIEGGSAVVISRYHHDRLLEYTKSLIASLNYSGWGLAEFKYCDRRRDFVFMELNAKFWASIEFALLNNSRFMRELFGVDRKADNVECALFLDRLLQLNFKEIWRHLKLIFKCHIIKNQSIMRILFLRCFPKFLRRKIKGILKRSHLK